MTYPALLSYFLQGGGEIRSRGKMLLIVEKKEVPISSVVAVKYVGMCMIHYAVIKMKSIPSCLVAFEYAFSCSNK